MPGSVESLSRRDAVADPGDPRSHEGPVGELDLCIVRKSTDYGAATDGTPASGTGWLEDRDTFGSEFVFKSRVEVLAGSKSSDEKNGLERVSLDWIVSGRPAQTHLGLLVFPFRSR